MLSPTDNVLANQARSAQTAAFQGQTQQNAFNALTTGVEQMVMGPGRQEAAENALAMQNANAERELITQAIQGVKSAPEAQRAQVYGQIVRDIEAKGIDIPDWAEDFNNFPVIEGMYSMPPAEATALMRNISMLPEDQQMQALGVHFGITPSADAQLRGQTGDRPTTAMQEYEFARGQGYEGSFQQWKNDGKNQGWSVTTNPDGTTTVSQGRPVGRTGQNQLDVKEIDARDQLARLDRIQVSAIENPNVADMNTLTGNLKRMGLEWKDFIASDSLTDEQAQYLVDVTTARGDILENVNFTIKEITGAAMTESEAKRIGATLPSVNDSPRMFKAKLDRATDRVRASIARYNIWRNQGMDGKPEQVGTISDIQSQMDKRFEDLAGAVESGDMTEEEANAVFASEFGL